MDKVVSATEARVHLGELMREVVESDRPVMVQRAGKEQVVILSVRRY
ncbi:MAG: type II toxin-antitoxin system Phd/YefM family antitoxin [Anaerolineae bacterium]|nr:type II toxin-antitoxin system Phd/YefM family antitoxin [Anaerolineae bacterium]